MKQIHFFGWPLLALLGVAGSINGQSPNTNINPALTYYQAFNTAPERSQADWDYLYTNMWDPKLPDRFGDLVSQYDSEFRLIALAAQSKAPCDWGIDWSAGPETLLGHLSRVKSAANVAELRVMWDLQHDRPAEAQKDLLATLAMGRNVSTDGSVIAALVQFAVERIVCKTMAENYNHFPPEVLRQLAAGFDAPPARGTIADAVGLEKVFGHWLVNHVLALQAENPGNDAKVMDGVQQLCVRSFNNSEGQNTNNPWPRILSASGGTSEGIVKLLRGMDPLYDRLQAIEALPPGQYEEQETPFAAEIQNSANPFVHELFPALEKLRPREFCAQADLAMVQAAVQYKLNGEAGLKSVANPLGGQFGVQRFIFDGVDRGFELSANYAGLGYPEVFIFVETDGAPFNVFGKNAGKTPTP